MPHIDPEKVMPIDTAPRDGTTVLAIHFSTPGHSDLACKAAFKLPKSGEKPTWMEVQCEEIDLKAMLQQRFGAGQGFVTLSASMTDEQILTLIKGACIWSKGAVFQVIPPKNETRNDFSQLKPFTCPYCGTPTPETDDLVLDEWGYFHCSEEECDARLQLDESSRAIGYINRKAASELS